MESSVAAPIGAGHQPPPVDTTARWLGWSWHVLVGVLVVAGAARAAETSGTRSAALSAAGLGCVALYGLASGAWPDFTNQHDRTTRWWPWAVGAALAGTGMAIATHPDAYLWLVFPLGLVLFHHLSVRVSASVGATLAVLSLGALSRVGPLTGPRVLGPVIGLAVAAAGAIAIRTLQAESTRRWELVVELRRTRDLAARHEHQAGILEERARLARDIHDTVAQGLSSILMLTSAIRGRWQDVPPDVARWLEQLDEVAQDDLAATRRLIADLAPADLERFDLPHALRRRADRVQEHTGVRVELDLDTLPPLAPPVEVAALRIVGQAMDNAVAHGRPTRIRVTAATAADALLVDVHDDGCGFDPTTRRGRGIAGMHARAEDLGGRLAIESRPGDGTVIALQLPLSPATDRTNDRTAS